MQRHKQASYYLLSCNRTNQIHHLSWKLGGGGCPVHQVEAVEGINSTSPLITNSGLLRSRLDFFHSSESHNYKLFLPQKFSRSLPSIRETCHSDSCSSPDPRVLILSEVEVVRTAWKLNNLRQVTQLPHLISPAWTPKSVCFLFVGDR